MPIIKKCTLARGTQPTDEIINNLLTSPNRKEQVRYYNTLKDYFSSVNVTSRPAPHEVKVVANNARYITKTNVGYLLGNPVQYLVSEGLNIDLIVDNYKKQTISNLDVELATDVSVYGHAFERVYTNELAEPWSTRINPSNIILAYDNSVQHNKLFAVIYNPVFDDNGKQLENEFDVTILTPELCMERRLKDGHLFQVPEIEDFMHGYGEVPVIEYMNSSDRMGDFEPVISLLDAYNILQSDRVIDRERLVDAILAFYGMNLTKEQRIALKESRTLAGIPADAKVEYIVKNINEADADVLRSSLLSDIHKISMTPDMSDQNFAGNSSGVALLYKLLAFEQHIKDKERYFENALIDRFRIYNRFFNLNNNMSLISPADVDVVFKRALPQNDYEQSQMINNLVGLVDKETLVAQLSFVNDAKETVELAKEENKPEFNDNYATGLPNVDKSNANDDEE